jgi:hypothetical protein
MIKLKFSLHSSSPNGNFGLTVCIQPNIALLVACTGKFIDEHLLDEQAQSRNLTFILGIFNEQFRFTVSYTYSLTFGDLNKLNSVTFLLFLREV